MHAHAFKHNLSRACTCKGKGDAAAAAAAACLKGLRTLAHNAPSVISMALQALVARRLIEAEIDSQLHGFSVAVNIDAKK
jgi:hypothetical protein